MLDLFMYLDTACSLPCYDIRMIITIDVTQIFRVRHYHRVRLRLNDVCTDGVNVGAIQLTLLDLHDWSIDWHANCHRYVQLVAVVR